MNPSPDDGKKIDVPNGQFLRVVICTLLVSAMLVLFFWALRKTYAPRFRVIP